MIPLRIGGLLALVAALLAAEGARRSSDTGRRWLAVGFGTYLAARGLGQALAFRSLFDNPSATAAIHWAIVTFLAGSIVAWVAAVRRERTSIIGLIALAMGTLVLKSAADTAQCAGCPNVVLTQSHAWTILSIVAVLICLAGAARAGDEALRWIAAGLGVFFLWYVWRGAVYWSPPSVSALRNRSIPYAVPSLGAFLIFGGATVCFGWVRFAPRLRARRPCSRSPSRCSRFLALTTTRTTSESVGSEFHPGASSLRPRHPSRR